MRRTCHLILFFYTFLILFLNELFLGIKSDSSEVEEVRSGDWLELFPKDGTLLLKESSLTIVIASCSRALAIERVTTCQKFQAPYSFKEMLTVNLGDLDFLLLRCTTTPELEISSFTSRRSTKVSSGSAKDDAECSDVVNFLESQLLKQCLHKGP